MGTHRDAASDPGQATDSGTGRTDTEAQPAGNRLLTPLWGPGLGSRLPPGSGQVTDDHESDHHGSGPRGGSGDHVTLKVTECLSGGVGGSCVEVVGGDFGATHRLSFASQEFGFRLGYTRPCSGLTPALLGDILEGTEPRPAQAKTNASATSALALRPRLCRPRALSEAPALTSPECRAPRGWREAAAPGNSQGTPGHGTALAATPCLAHLRAGRSTCPGQCSQSPPGALGKEGALPGPHSVTPHPPTTQAAGRESQHSQPSGSGLRPALTSEAAILGQEPSWVWTRGRWGAAWH